MRLSTILLAPLLLSGCMLVVPVPPPAPEGAVGTVSTSSGPALPQAAFGSALNDLRARSGLGPLAADRELAAAAQAHARDMAAQGYFSHQGRDGSNSGDRARRAGCDWRSTAENIAQGQTSEAQVLEGWAGSPGHRRNMLGSRYERYGLGRSGTTWVLMFADRC